MEDFGLPKLSIDTNPILNALGGVIDKANTLDAAVKRFHDAQRGYQTQLAEAANAASDKFRAQVGEIQNARRVQRELNDTAAEYAATIRRLSQDRTDATDVARKKQLTEEIRQQKRELEKVRVELRLNKQAIADEQQAARALTDERRQQVQQERLAAAARRDAAAAARQEAAAAKVAQTGSSPNPNNKGGLFGGLLGGEGLLGSISSRIPALAAGLFSVNAIIDKIRSGVEKRAQVTGLQNTLQAVAGTANAGAQEFAYIKREAQLFGLELIPAGKSYAGLFAAAKEANLSLADTRGIFEGVTAAGKALDLSNEDIEGSLRAVSQMLGKGKVSSEELRQQLGERLPVAMGVAAKALGLTTAQLDEQLRKGQILAKDFLPKFAAELKKSYGQGSADAATQLRSNLNRITTFIDEQSAKIGAAVAPAVKAIADLVGAPAKLSEGIQGELTDLDILRQKLSETNIGQKERVALIQELQRQYPEYLGNLNAETATNQQLSAAIDKVSESLVNRLILQQEDEKLAEQAAETAERRLEVIKAEQALRAQLLELEKQNEAQRRRGATRVDARGETRPAASIREEVQGLPLDLQAREALTLIQQRQAGIAATTSSVDGLREALGRYQKAQVALATEEEKGNDIEQEKRLIMQALGIENNRLAASTTANAAAQKGYIEQLREEIKELTKNRDELAKTAPGYYAQVDQFNAQIAKKQEELRKLENKEERGAKTRENKLEAARKALRARERKLQDEHEKTLLEAQRFNGELRIKEQYKQDLAAIAELERSIVEAEKLVAKRGGKGAEADAKLSAAQRDVVNALILQAERTKNEGLEELDRQTNARILELQAESDSKELAQLRAKFNEEIRIARLAQNERLAVEIEGAKQRTEAELLRQQEVRRIREEEQFRLNAVERGERFTQQAADPTADQSLSPELDAAKKENIIRKLLARAAVDIEREKQKDLLRIRIKAQQDILAAYANDTSREGAVIRDNAKTVLDGLNKALGNLENQTPKIDLLKALGVKDEDREKVQQALDQVGAQFLSAVQGYLQAEQDAARARIEASNQRINELQNDLQAEIALSKTGAASNIQAAKDEIEQQKQLRREAQEDAKKAAKAKLLLDTALQLSSLATATATIFAVTAELNLVPGLGVAIATALSTAMVGAFIASKVKALSAINAGSEGYFKGGYTGGNSIYEERGPTHGKEFVFDNEKTAAFRRSLFEPLHAGRPQDIDWGSLAQQGIMPNILPNYELPRQMQQDQQKLVILQQQQSIEPLRQEIGSLRSKLGDIEKHVAKTANTPQRVPLGDNEIIEFDGKNERRVDYGPRKGKPAAPKIPPGINGGLKRVS